MEGVGRGALSPFTYIRQHALLPHASRLGDVDADMHRLITPEFLTELVDSIPAEWFEQSMPDIAVDEQRRVYREFLTRRLANSKIFTDYASAARKTLV